MYISEEPMALKWISLKVKPPEGNKKTTSNKKIEANKQNAKLSTGPKSPEGKKHSSRNAIKHGLLTKNLVGPGENDRECRLLLAGLTESYRPTNFAQEMKVESVVVSYWRSMRSIRRERGDLVIWSPPSEPESQPFIDLTTLVPSSEERESLLKTSNGIETLIANVEIAQMEVEDNGTIPKDVPARLQQCSDLHLAAEHCEGVCGTAVVPVRVQVCATIQKG